jgi:hypothetical protein
MPPRKKGATRDKIRGYRFGEIVEKVFPDLKSRNARAKELGFDEKNLRDWEAGANIDNRALKRLVELGGNLEYLLLGTGSPLCEEGKSAPRPTREADEEGTASVSGSAAPEVLEAIAEHQAVLNSILRILLREPGKAHRVREALQACEEPLSRLREIS